MEEPWAVPPGCQRVSLRRATDGARPRLPTDLVLFADDECLNVLFHLAPKEPTRYFEIEVNPLGTTFDARIDSPHGTREAMRIDTDWDCANLFAAVRKMNDVIDTIIRIPFASLDARRPATGEEWRGNLFRIDRSARHGDEFSAWQPTLKNPADFHVAAAFGRLRFE